MSQMPSYDAFNDAVEKLLQSLKYLKLNEYILKKIVAILEWIWKIIKRLIGDSANLNGVSSTTKIILSLIVAFIAVLMLVLIVLFILRLKKKKRVKSILGEKIDHNSTVLSFLDRSQLLEEKGQYREAIRLRFISVLFYLHQNHILYHDSTMTGLEMVEKLREDGFNTIAEFEKMTAAFNVAWYGMREIEAENFQNWVVVENQFWQEVKK